MKYGYMRVSTTSQSLDRQEDSLAQYHLDRIFSDKKSGKDFERKGYQQLKSLVQRGDEVYIHALDRLGRNKDALKDEWRWFKDNGVVLRVLNMPTTMIDLDGQEWVVDMINNIILEVLSALAQQEREEIGVRIKEGLASAKARGVRLGGKPIDVEKIGDVDELRGHGVRLVDACKSVGISPTTYRKYKKMGVGFSGFDFEGELKELNEMEKE